MSRYDDDRFRSRPAEWPTDEGGLRAPPDLKGWRRAWWWFDFVVLVNLARLRFVFVLLVIGLVIVQWDTLLAYYDRWIRPASYDTVEGSDVEWFCPMDPGVIRPTNREKCPICFMPLSKRKKSERQEVVLPPGTVSRVQLSPYRILLAGARTSAVDYQPLTNAITAVGYVEFNERLQRTVAARVAGRIDNLYVNETGRFVSVDDDLAHLYSPDLNVTVQNLLDAKRTGNADLVESATQRLLLWGVDEDQIHECLVGGKPVTHVRIRSPISGHIIQKYVREGQYVSEGAPLYDLADLSIVWIEAQVYEDDMALLPLADVHRQNSDMSTDIKATARTRAFPDKVFHGMLSFIYPHVDQSTRSVTVRCEINNRGPEQLMPGATATVTLEIEPAKVIALQSAAAGDAEREEQLAKGRVLAVPESSVIATGNQTIVYRESLPGVYDGTLVVLGPRMNGADDVAFFPVLKGLAPGDRVVTSGSFLIDAETRLNPAAGSIYYGGVESKSRPPEARSVRPSTPADINTTVAAALAKLPPAERAAAEAQKFCAVLDDSRLGSMGTPVKVEIDGQTVFVCCENCVKEAREKPKETLERARNSRTRPTRAPADRQPPGPPPAAGDDKAARIKASLARLPDEDRRLAELQRECPVNEGTLLGSMGVPVELSIDGQSVFLCCKNCTQEANADPQATLQKALSLRRAHAKPDNERP